MRLLRHFAWLAAITVLLGGTAALVVATSPAASAAPSAAHDGWVRCAHLSPNSPPMDIYMYPFGLSGNPTVLRHVSYGSVSAYMAVSPGQYSVAIRDAGAPASAAPLISTSFTVSARTAYTVAGIGPASGVRLVTLKDQMTVPMGKALVRVIQASLKNLSVTVSYGPDVLARQLAFGSATSYLAISPSSHIVQFAASNGHTAMPVKFAADTVHTIVVLDGSSGLKVDALTDAVGSQMMPMGGVNTGFGGTAARTSAADPVPWRLVIAAGMLLAAMGLTACCKRRPSRWSAR